MAFALPMMDRLSKDPYGICGLILTPTRELGQQIKEQFESLGGVKVLLVTGGTDSLEESHAIIDKPHFVVATPGRYVLFIF